MCRARGWLSDPGRIEKPQTEKIWLSWGLTLHLECYKSKRHMEQAHTPTARAEAPSTDTTLPALDKLEPGPPPAPPTGPQRVARAAWWLVRVLAALFVFVLALQVMKTGAAGFSVLQGDGFLVRNAGSTLGLGWLGALFVLSGSPIAASSLTLVKAESISETEGFTMLTGSRLGAAFVVLLVAVIYALRSKQGGRMKPVSTAVMALVTTALVYVPGSLIGYALLQWGPFRSVDIGFPPQFDSIIDLVYGPLLERIESLPAAVLFLGGLGILLLSFKLIDTVLPHLDEATLMSTKFGWLKRKWPMFWLGCFVAFVAMSVSVALTVLVPLVVKGYVKREAILPYIMGANITTLGDTLLAAFLLHSSAAVRIVLAGIVGTTIVSLVVLAFFYPSVRRGVWKFQRQMVKNKPRLAMFTAALFLMPLAIILFSGLVG
jgi:solute carrier family 34 (sodium-dependent phosphate cotransporter)